MAPSIVDTRFVGRGFAAFGLRVNLDAHVDEVHDPVLSNAGFGVNSELLGLIFQQTAGCDLNHQCGLGGRGMAVVVEGIRPLSDDQIGFVSDRHGE